MTDFLLFLAGFAAGIFASLIAIQLGRSAGRAGRDSICPYCFGWGKHFIKNRKTGFSDELTCNNCSGTGKI
jgi:hypothetical protein